MRVVDETGEPCFRLLTPNIIKRNMTDRRVAYRLNGWR